MNDTDVAFGVLEDLREHLRDEGMHSEADTLNEAHCLIQDYGHEIR